jgi:hypothetical protein
VQGLRIEVLGATGQPRQPTNDASALQRDFGLKLLQALPDRRGTEQRSGPRMVVWAELNVPSRTGACNVN